MCCKFYYYLKIELYEAHGIFLTALTLHAKRTQQHHHQPLVCSARRTMHAAAQKVVITLIIVYNKESLLIVECCKLQVTKGLHLHIRFSRHCKFKLSSDSDIFLCLSFIFSELCSPLIFCLKKEWNK